MLRLHLRSGSGGRRRLWLGAATAIALLAYAAPAQAAPFVYVTNEDGASVSQYDAGAGGLLAPLFPPTVAAGPGPREVAVSPDGASVYLTNGGNDSVSQYDAGAGGALTPKSPPTVAAGANPIGVAVSPDGGSVYVANFIGGNFGGTVSQYDVGPGGALTPKSPPTVFADHDPSGVAVSPDGQSVYVTNFHLQENGTLSQYDVGPGGTLSPKSPATVGTGEDPVQVAVSPDGKSVYVTNNGSNTVSQYDVGAGGKLTPKSPATVAGGGGPFGVAVSPDGKSVYVTNLPRESASPTTVSQYDVGAGGKLTPKSPAMVAAGIAPEGVAVSPDGQSVYVANNDSNTVSQYDVGAGGKLTPKSPATVAGHGGPRGVAVSPTNCRMKGAGRFTDTVASNGRVVRKGDSLSSDRGKPVGPPNSGIAQRLHLAWGPPTNPTQHKFSLTTKLTLADCIDTAGVNPGQGQTFDTLLAEGGGTVNGSPGFHIRIRLTDGGENPSGSGNLKDRVRVKITKLSNDRQVLQASGRLGAGNQDARDGA